MNSICLIGRNVKDVEVFKDTVGKISVAVPRQFKNKDGNYDTDFFDCVIFNVNDYLKENLKKGVLVSVEGRLQTRTYEDNGKKYRITEIITNRVNVLGNSQKTVETSKNSQSSDKNKPFEEFGQQFEVGKQIEIDESSDLPF